MKVLILAGGKGSRLSEETGLKPKPMVEIGGKPILWHIMKIYSYYGFNEFIILLGYMGYAIKEYFVNYYKHMSDITIDLKSNNIEFLKNYAEPWKITLIDTGIDTLTGGRIKRAENLIKDDSFMLTYGDGVSDININDLVKFHKTHQKAITMTSVQPEGRFGALNIDENNKVTRFMEKPQGNNAWINGGFFVCEPKILNYIEDDKSIFERDPLENLASDGELYTYKHNGFWKPMDTLRDKIELDNLINNGKAPWMNWK